MRKKDTPEESYCVYCEAPSNVVTDPDESWRGYIGERGVGIVCPDCSKNKPKEKPIMFISDVPPP